MFDQYEALTKEQYPDFNFSGWKCGSVMKTIHGFEEICVEDYDGEDYYYTNKYHPFAYKIPNGYVCCVFTNVKANEQMFFMIDIRGIK